MKIKDGFALRSVGGVDIIVAIGKRTKDINGVITLNKTGAFIAKDLFGGKDKEQTLSEYSDFFGVSAEEAANDYDSFLKKIEEAGIVE